MYPSIKDFSEENLKKIDIRILEKIKRDHSIKIAYDYLKQNKNISFYCDPELGGIALEWKNKEYKIKYIQFPKAMHEIDSMLDKQIGLGWAKLLLDSQRAT
jgi:hypothetical protein